MYFWWEIAGWVVHAELLDLVLASVFCEIALVQDAIMDKA
jgi:hypothetical protein